MLAIEKLVKSITSYDDMGRLNTRVLKLDEASEQFNELMVGTSSAYVLSRHMYQMIKVALVLPQSETDEARKD